ncbi:hypothetical protein K440DRAFT_628761 [Wilcoxina mikolae CBS 423.85]|nr:hypothetical protein K440DRAFT_628761 [Wilcoxina mikolae CBS 423.85]
MAPSRETLLSAALCLCTDFACPSTTTAILLTHFTTSVPPTAIEHGHPSLAPFIGRAFNGRDEVARYFDMLARLLTFENMRFCEYIVDVDTLKVTCKGCARFTWKKTNQSWDETFTYTLDFMEEGGPGDGERQREVKVRRYQVWADTGVAYLASRGELEEVGEGACCRE